MSTKTESIVQAFQAKYKLHKLVYYEFFPTIEDAIIDEKYLKGKKRQKKTDLINAQNPE